LRALRVSAPAQLFLPLDPVEQCWWRLPVETRAAVVSLLARLIARGVVVDAAADGDGNG
jgi:hypothetical protein